MTRRFAVFAAALVLVGVTAAPAAADSVRDRQWYLSDLDIAAVHRITRGAGVTVAVLDTGVEAKHRDLAGAVVPGYNHWHSKWEDSTGRTDVEGHGTQMAGLIAGRGHGSGDGVLGIAPAAKILPIAAPVNGFRSSSFMRESIDFAIAHHAGVINMSFGSAGDEQMHEMIRKAQAADIVLVASSGNRGEVGDYPGRYPEVLTVGAYDKRRKIASYSVTGPQVDLVAPGDRIITTSKDAAGYYVTSGTSGATAIVSGAAALLRARYPTMSAAEVVHRLTATADDAGPPGRDDTYGYGLLNVRRALTADLAALPATPAATSGGTPPPTSAGPPSAADTTALPRAASPLLLAVIAAGLVLLPGAVVILFMVRRRRAA